MGKKIAIMVISLLVLYGCATDNQKQEEQTIETKKQLEVPQFNKDSAFFFIEKQISFGPRVPGSKASAACAEFLVNKLKSYKADVIVQEAKVRAFDGTILPIKNIIASWQPENKKRVMLCAHWDTRPFADYDPDVKNHNKPIPGANDGASGVAVLLEIARLISENQPNVGIDIILFDAEDYGEPKDSQNKIKEDNWGLGSQYWSNNPHKKGYVARYGILLDMVGAKNATFYLEGYSRLYARHILNKVWDKAAKLGFENYFIKQDSSPVTDDHYYINTILGLPTINIIHQDKQSKTGFFPYWHTMEDNIDKIDKETLYAVGQTVLTVIFSEE